MKVLAGIVLYNPNLERLKENINSILKQVDSIVCIDNGSNNIDAIKELLNPDIYLIEFKENLGIATALNEILFYASRKNYEWFLTLDQDSVCMPFLIENYEKHLYVENPGIIGCTIKDRNFKTINNKKNDIDEIKECITSASFCNTAALIKVGGFSDEMFIDSVDFDICLKLRKNGYKIYKIGYVGLLHEVGKGKNVRLLWKEKVAYNHSALRNYYMARNHIYMAHKYPKDISIVNVILKEIEFDIIILFFEKNKIRKLRMRYKGIIDGIKKKMGKYDEARK